jgi:Zn-finger nucleic acid-binding protein
LAGFFDYSEKAPFHKVAASNKERLMYCPTCATTRLVQTERQKVEVDYCPHCRGIWLDRGELEKLLDKAATSSQARLEPSAGARSHIRPQGRRERRRSWLSEILD